MHGLGVYHLPGSTPEVITSTAPASAAECLHARVARLRLLYESHPRTPMAVRWFFLESIIHRLRNTLNGNRPSWSFDPGPAQPPSGCQMVLALIHRGAFRTAFSRVSSWVEIRCSSSTRNRWDACMHGCGTCSSCTGKPPKRSF
jgi:hypothetical protein